MQCSAVKPGVRKAGQVVQDPGLWEWLGDNGFTRGWSGAAADLIRPVDRMVASDADLRGGLAKKFGAQMAQADLEDPKLYRDVEKAAVMLDFMDQTGRTGQLWREKAPQYIAQQQELARAGGHGNLSVEEAAQAFFRDSLGTELPREALLRGVDEFGPHLPVSQPGVWAHAALGHPAMAYGATAAGLGAAGYGAYQLMNQQGGVTPALDPETGMVVG